MSDPNNLFNLLTNRVKEQGITSYIIQQKMEMDTLDKINRELFQFIKDETNWVFDDLDTFIDTYKILMENQQIRIDYVFNEYCFKFYHSYNDFGKSVLNKLSEQLEEDDSDYQPTEEDELIILDDIQDDIDYDNFINVEMDSDVDIEMN